MKKIINPDLGLFILRLALAAVFITHGWMKVADMSMPLGMFSSMNIPAVLTYIVSYGELIGGLLLILGIWTECTAFFLGVIMVVAIYFTVPAGFQMYALPLATFGGLGAILGSGAGKYTVMCKCN